MISNIFPVYPHTLLLSLSTELDNKRIKKCITSYKSDPMNLFNRMGKSYNLDDKTTLYMDCRTRIGVKQKDGSYVLSGTECQIVIITKELKDDDGVDITDNFCYIDKVEGNVYYIREKDPYWIAKINKWKNKLLNIIKNKENISDKLLAKLNDLIYFPSVCIEYEYPYYDNMIDYYLSD